MPRLALFNMGFGFFLLFFASLVGVLLVWLTSDAIVVKPEVLTSWPYILLKSSHGHTSLFGIVQVLFGLSLPYSNLSARFKLWQTVCLSWGSLTMAFLLLFRAQAKPTIDIDLLGFIIGLGLSAFFIALFGHFLALFKRVFAKSF